jgi:GPH family glycoside/pentoside/hexuronide:cation symporter
VATQNGMSLDADPIAVGASKKEIAQKDEVGDKCTSAPKRPELLPLRAKLLLSLGESVQGIWATIAGFFLNTYLLEVCCLDPVDVSIIQLCQGLFDAVNDPMIGYLSDHTRTRWGRRRPWLLGGGPILAIFYFGLWSKLTLDVGETGRLFYYLICYMGVSVGVTMIQLQIASLTPELTDDYDERTTISAYRLVAVVISGLIGVLLHTFIVSTFTDRAHGYRFSGAVFACLVLLATWTVFAGIREKFIPEQESPERLGILKELKTLLCNKAFLCVIAVYLCGPTAVVLVQTNLFMFCKYILGNEDFIFFVILSVQGWAIVTAPMWVLIGQRFGKRQIYFLGGPVLAVGMFSISFVESESIALLIATVIGFCLGIVYLTPYSLLPDVIEDDELRTGKRREGIFAGFFTISLKLTVTFALTITNVALKVSGYESPKITCGIAGEGKDAGVPDSQPPAVMQSIRWLIGPIPSILICTATFFAWSFPITKESHAALVEEVKRKRQANLEKNCKSSEGTPENDCNPSEDTPEKNIKSSEGTPVDPISSIDPKQDDDISVTEV